MTILTINKQIPEKLSGKLSSLFFPQKLTHTEQSFGSYTIHHVQCDLSRGYPDLKKLSRLLPVEENRILCDEDVSLLETPFSRFESVSLTRHMMQNFIKALVKKSNGSLREIHTCFYDPQAEMPLFLDTLQHYFRHLTVVSDMPRFYENEAIRIADDSGAVIRVSNSPDALAGCQIVIAPSKINRPLPSVHSTIIFSTAKPLVSMPGTIISGYTAAVPDRYRSFMPEGIKTSYFLSGLYELCHEKSLSEIIPYAAVTDRGIITISEILSFLCNGQNSDNNI